MQVEKKIIKISFATILTELPVSLREKRNANEILICCLGFYVAPLFPGTVPAPQSEGSGVRDAGARAGRGNEKPEARRPLGLRKG